MPGDAPQTTYDKEPVLPTGSGVSSLLNDDGSGMIPSPKPIVILLLTNVCAKSNLDPA
jgi:hypothetical protein